jgi:hypothetical protein
LAPCTDTHAHSPAAYRPGNFSLLLMGERFYRRQSRMSRCIMTSGLKPPVCAERKLLTFLGRPEALRWRTSQGMNLILMQRPRSSRKLCIVRPATTFRTFWQKLEFQVFVSALIRENNTRRNGRCLAHGAHDAASDHAAPSNLLVPLNLVEHCCV